MLIETLFMISSTDIKGLLSLFSIIDKAIESPNESIVVSGGSKVVFYLTMTHSVAFDLEILT